MPIWSHWNGEQIYLSYWIWDLAQSPGDNHRLRNAACTAIERWNQVVGHRLTLVPAVGDGFEIAVGAGREIPHGLSQNTLAWTDSEPPWGDELSGASIYVLPQVGKASQRTREWVMAHELGHALGLRHPRRNARSVVAWHDIIERAPLSPTDLDTKALDDLYSPIPVGMSRPVKMLHLTWSDLPKTVWRYDPHANNTPWRVVWQPGQQALTDKGDGLVYGGAYWAEVSKPTTVKWGQWETHIDQEQPWFSFP